MTSPVHTNSFMSCLFFPLWLCDKKGRSEDNKQVEFTQELSGKHDTGAGLKSTVKNPEEKCNSLNTQTPLLLFNSSFILLFNNYIITSALCRRRGFAGMLLDGLEGQAAGERRGHTRRDQHYSTAELCNAFKRPLITYVEERRAVIYTHWLRCP